MLALTYQRDARTGREGRRAVPSAVRRPGITLLEVLLGLAIFLMALVALGRLVDMGADEALNSMLQSDGTRLAQSKLAEFEAGVEPVDAGGSGTFLEEPNWSWNATSTPAGVPNLYTVKVTVSYDRNGTTFDVSLEQMMVNPNFQGTAAEIAKPETSTSGTTTSTTP